MGRGTFNVLKLKGQLAERGLNITQLATLIGMNRDTLYRRMRNGGAQFRLGDVRKICEVLHLSYDAMLSIFFDNTTGCSNKQE